MQIKPPRRSPWKLALELDPARKPRAGSTRRLASAIARGADLRIYTEFLHEEHIAPFSSTDANHPRHNGLIREVIDFRQTILVQQKHAAGVTLYRQPLEPTQGFNGSQPKMSFFLYNATAHQACANLLLDDTAFAPPGTLEHEPSPAAMPKMGPMDVFDLGTSGPSRNFIYDMEVYRYFVCDNWSEILSHDAEGRILSGSFETLEEAHSAGREFKLAITGLCDDLSPPGAPRIPHEIFTFLGSGFLHTTHRYHEVLTHPIVRIAPGIPVQYASQNWDVSWVSVRTDGYAVIRTLDPFTRKFSDRKTRLACRWFVR